MRLQTITSAALASVLIGAPLLVAQSPRGNEPRQESPKSETKSDDAIAKQVRAALKHSQLPSQPSHRIDVQVKEGKVYLSGTVSSEDESDRAWQVASHIAGLNMVANALQVKPSGGA